MKKVILMKTNAIQRFQWTLAGCVGAILIMSSCGGKSSPAPAPPTLQIPAPLLPIIEAPSIVTSEAQDLNATIKAQDACTYAWTIEGGKFAGGASSATGLEVQFSAGQIGKLKLECRARNAAGMESAPAAKSLNVVAAPIIESFSAEKGLVNQGAEAQLTAVFHDGKGEIEGLGPVRSGVGLSTGPLNAQKRFRLNVTNEAGTQISRELVVNVVGGPSILAFKAAKPTLTQGEGTTLWVEYSGGVGSIDGLGSVKSGTTVSTGPLFESSSYTLNVDNGAGAVARQTLQLQVVAPPSIEAFTAEKNPLNLGEGTRLIARFKDGTAQIEGLGPVSSGVPIPTGSLNASKRFKLVVTNAAGAKVEGELAVNALEKPVIQSFVAEKTILKEGGETTLTARFSGGEGHIEGLGDVKSGIPISTGALKAGRTYRLRVSNLLDAEAFSSVDVSVAERPVIGSFTVTPAIVTEGDPVTLAYAFKGGAGKLAGMDGLPESEFSGGSLELKPLKSGSCTLTVTNLLGETDQATVNISVVPAPVIRSFTSKGLVNRGESTTLVADFEHGVGTLDQGLGEIQSGEIITGSLNKLKLYTLTVTNAVGKSVKASVLAGPPEQKRLAAGINHSVCIKPDGSVWAWGRNRWRELGSRTPFEYSSKALQVPNLPACRAVAAGAYHTLALDNGGRVWSWGDGGNGRLGHGESSYAEEAQCIEGLQGVVAIAGGGFHSLALTKGGEVWAWGDNYNGQIGDGSQKECLRPSRVFGLLNVVSIAAGPRYSLALTRDGNVWAWGEGILSPTLQRGFENAIGISACPRDPYHLKADGSLWKGGFPSEVPYLLSAMYGVESVASGYYFSIGKKADGSVWRWGRMRDEVGELDYVSESQPIESIKGVVEIAAGEDHCVALKEDGSLWTWGENEFFQLGTGEPIVQFEPKWVKGLPDVQALVSGWSHSVALDTQGQVWVWGDNKIGQLGKSWVDMLSLPEPKPELGVVARIAAGYEHTLILKKDGSVWAWGANQSWQLGSENINYSNVPLKVEGLPERVRAIAAWGNSSMALDEEGYIWVWGIDNWKQTAQGRLSVPTKVSDPKEVTEIFGGCSRGYGLKNGKVWGQNAASGRPVEWPILKNIVSICNGRSEIALDDQGSLWSWYPRFEEIPQVRMQNILSIAGGFEHNLALNSQGEVWAWGKNTYGNIGTEKGECDITRPVKVFERNDLILVVAGCYQSFAITIDRKVLAWGDDTRGQLGLGRMLWSAKPVEVQFAEEEPVIGGGSPDASR